MSMIIQILKVNPIREGVGRDSGRPYRMQDAECATLDEAGNIDQVGVLNLSNDQVGVTTTGIYAATVTLVADRSKTGGGRLVPRLTGLVPLQKTPKGFVPLEAAKVAA